MSDEVFKGLIIAIYVIVLGYFIGKFIYTKVRKKKIMSEGEANRGSIDNSSKKSFSEIRHGHVKSDTAKDYTHMIAETFEEIFQMFMSISPDVVQTVLKIERTMVLLQGEFDKPTLDTKRIDDLLGFMMNALNQLEEVSSQLIDRMVSIYFENKPLKGEVKIDSQLIEGYITIVNSLEDISINYTYHLQRLLKNFREKYPEKLSEYTTVSEKLVFVLYVVVTCCSSRLDRHINVYNIYKTDRREMNLVD